MVALTHWVCFLTFLRELLMLCSPVFVLCFGGLFVWVVSCLLEAGQSHPNSERSTVLLCCQLPTYFRNISIVIWCLSARRLFVSDDIRNTVVCFHPYSLLSRTLWVPTCDVLLCAFHALQSSFESGPEARIVKIDFSAAFDMVNHQGILYKLCSVCIGG